ncbi:MAG: succinylglutamate desuccinylase/aspartoacylase family protein [Alphaproteobacteria bacterium]
MPNTPEPVETKVFTDIDYDRQGRQVSVLRVPNSNNLSGWGTVGVPIGVVANGDGPTVLLTGGVHGDEYEGQITLVKLLRTLEPASIRGRVVVIPALHFPAAMAGSRMSPIDGRDINRCFPGDPYGSFAQVLAHYVAHVIVPRVDALFDVHSGGRGLNIAPSTCAHHSADPAMMARLEALARACGAPTHMFLKSVDENRTLPSAAERRGILSISSEFGGGGIVQLPALQAAERAVHNFLVHLGVLQADPIAPPAPTRLVETPDLGAFTFAPCAGIFEPYHALGTAVEKGMPAGAIHLIEAPTAEPHVVSYGASGMLWCTRGAGRTEPGDPVAIVAADWNG